MKYLVISFCRPFSRISFAHKLLFVLVINVRFCLSYTVITDKDAEELLYDKTELYASLLSVDLPQLYLWDKFEEFGYLATELNATDYIEGQLQNWIDLGLISDRAVNEAIVLPDKLKGLYKTLKNYPAVMNRRLQIGGSKPPFYPDGSSDVEKRSVFDFGLAQPACPFKTQWQLLYTAKDMNNTTVEVFQPTDDSNRYQWFYTVSCDFERLNREAAEQNLETTRFCRGINRQRFVSVCVPRKSYIMALVRKSRDFNYDWDYIQVDTSCNCAVTPLPHI